jgi:hypothetical protein
MISDPTPTAQPISAQPGQTQSLTPGGGWFFWKFLAILELIIAYLTYRENSQSKRLPLFFLAAFIGSLVVIYGKVDGVFSWITAGLPILAIMSFSGYQRAAAGSRVKGFLGFTMGFAIVAEIYLFTQAMINPDLTFLGDRLTDPINKLIGCLSFALFAFGLGAKNKIIRFVFCSLGVIVLIPWLGTDVINRIQTRYPKQLTPPPVSQKIKDAGEKVLDNTLDFITGEKAKADAAAAAKTKHDADEAARKQKLEEMHLQVEMQKKNKSPTQPATGTGKIDRYVIPATGTPPFSEVIQVGGWNVFPLGTTVREIWEDKARITNGTVIVLRETKQCFSPPPGTKEVILTRK